jgi:branched-subunit amino acid transport protein AzlD
MTLTPVQTLVIIAMVALGTMITRFLPFILFPDTRENHPYIQYLGQVLPYAVIGLLVVYCLKDVQVTTPHYGLPEAAAIALIAVLHTWKGNTLLSIGAGTAFYMLIVQKILPML